MAALGPETLTRIFGLRVTNTLVATLLVDAILLLLVFVIRRRLSLVPGMLQGAAEAVHDWISTTTAQVAGARMPMIFPWVAVFFVYILVSNLVGLLPGVGTIGFTVRAENGAREFVPLLRASTSDLNTTLALAIVSLVATHALAIRSTGFVAWLRHFISFKLFGVMLFVGILEIIAEITKLFSLSLRLFGNVFAGEMVLGTMNSLFKWILPVPFLALETLVAVVQAMIFSMLTMAFMAVLTEPHQNGGSH